MEKILQIAGIVVASVTGLVGIVVGVGLFFYALIGWFEYLFSDPFNWVPDRTETVYPTYDNQPDVVACREKGGVAIRSGWTGGIRECQLTPKAE